MYNIHRMKVVYRRRIFDEIFMFISHKQINFVSLIMVASCKIVTVPYQTEVTEFV